MKITFCGKVYERKNNDFLNKESSIIFRVKDNYLQFLIKTNKQKISYDIYLENYSNNIQKCITFNENNFIVALSKYLASIESDSNILNERSSNIHKEFDKVFILL